MAKKKTTSQAEETPGASGADPNCICRGNWRSIVKRAEPLIGRHYRGPDGKKYTFFGVVHGNDDFYYGMSRKGSKLQLLSCVGSIESYGFTPLDDLVSLHALRAIAVEAIRSVTGCSDIQGKGGKTVVDEIEAVALRAARSR